MFRDAAGTVPEHLVDRRRGEVAAVEPHCAARAASSADQQNSSRNSGFSDLSYASVMFASDTDLLPYRSRIA